MKIIDCFPFYNELSMLELRLKELNQLVDHFVLVESTVSFANKSKPLFYDENKELFEEYHDKIIHVVVDDMPPDKFWKSKNQTSLKRAQHQRNKIREGIEQCSPSAKDIILISDVDEIPDTNTLKDTVERGFDKIYNLKQDMYYYNTTCKSKDPWSLAIISSYNLLQPYLKDLDKLRRDRTFCKEDEKIEKGGWHLTYFGGTEAIINKLQNFSAHKQFGTDEFTSIQNVESAIANNLDLFDRDGHSFERITRAENRYLPEHINMIEE